MRRALCRPLRRWRTCVGVSLLGTALSLTGGHSAQARSDDPPQAESEPQAQPPPEASAALFLERIWPGYPEWLAMLGDIGVKGTNMGGRDGWFRKAVPQIRFDWPATRAAYDANGDDQVTQSELPIPEADFSTLDRNQDGCLSELDFDFRPTGDGPSPGQMLFSRADRDGNGRLTREEFDSVFRSLDREGLGFLSQDDLRAAFAMPGESLADRTGGPDSLTRMTLLNSFVRRELGSFHEGPALNDYAPSFQLATADGQTQVRLDDLIGEKPVVLVFGNFTCSPFRGQAGNIEKLYHKYRDRAHFLMIYVREAHPTDGWRMATNDHVGVSIAQPTTYAERSRVAQTCGNVLGLGFPVLVDTIDDSVNDAYSGIPSRLYVIDRAGRVAYKSGRGPFLFRPSEMEQSLLLLLASDSAAAAPASNPTSASR